jgi:osmotically-inducible protein OsmY
MRSDNDIKQNVEAELRWTPDVDERDIAVKVTDGAVTLTGFVHDYHQKCLAESAAKGIKGVTAVANDIIVRLLSSPSDPEIARAAVSALKRVLPTVWEHIKPIVKQGSVSLSGSVEWHYERAIAEDAIRHLQGIISIDNCITVKPSLPAQSVKSKIHESFRRMADIDVNHISVNTRGGQVTLRGKVRSWAERDAAERSAWSAPGVTSVMNQLDVRN